MTPKIAKYRKSDSPVHGVVVYAEVQSRSRPEIRHTVTGTKRGSSITWRCSCPKKMFNPRATCDHTGPVKDKYEGK